MQNQMVVSKVKRPMEEPDVSALKVDVSHHFVTDQIFDSRAQVVKWCREVGSKIKVVVVTVKSDQPTSRRSGRLVLGCARGGVPRDYNKPGQKKKVKETQEVKTKKCGCPFTLRGVPLPEDKWKLKVQCGEHNHPVETALVGHSYFGRLSCEEERIGSEMTECKFKSRGVLKTIKKENRTNLSSMRKIYYTRANIRLTDRVPRLSMQQIESILSKTNIKVFPFDTALDVQKRKSRLGRKYIEAFPESMKVYISDIHEIKGDGNCGFRAVAELIGLRDEDAWQKVRTDLMVEVINNSQQYTKMFGNELLNEIINSLMCFDSPCQRANWMCMPYTGYLIASAYKVVFVFLSKQQCITFFPTRDSPIPGLPHRLITVGYVYDCHFVSVYLKPDAPIPPIASLWLNHHNEAADIWPSTYIGRIRVFQEIIPPEVVTSDHFEIDD